jgi:beta-glucanase (GH16 family)
MRRLLIAVLAVLSLVGAASATAAGAAPVRPHHTLVVHRHFKMGGSYRVRIVITTHSLRPNHIRIRIGSMTQHAMTKRHHRRITIWLQMAVRTHTVTIDAVGTHARPTLTIDFHPVSLFAIPNPAATHRPSPHTVTTPHKPHHSGTTTPLSPTQAVTVVHHRIGRPGLYRVKVRISAHRRDRVRIRIGAQTRYATVAVNRHASLTFTVRMRSRRRVTVRASGDKAPPQVQVTVQPVTPAADGGTPTSSNPPAGATGPTGPTGVTGTSPSGTLAPIGAAGNWRIAFDDEFSTSSLDTSLWGVGWFGSGITKPVNGLEDACYDPANVSESSGELDLGLVKKTENCGGGSEPYAGALVSTNGRFSFTYGFVEVRAWLAGSGSTVYDWPQIWTDGQSWPQNGEIDLLEGLGGGACYHWHGPPSGVGYGSCPGGSFAGGWHTFGVDWEPGVVTYYYDGHNVGSVANITSLITSSPMYLILTASTSTSSVVQAPVTERFDYVRVWQHGSASSTTSPPSNTATGSTGPMGPTGPTGATGTTSASG